MPIEAKKMANSPSRTMTRKIDFTTEAVVCRPSDSALPFTLRPAVQATIPITTAMNGALIMPTLKCVIEIASLRRATKTSGLDSGVELRGQLAAVERGHGAEEGQDGERDRERDDARQHQRLDWVEAHGFEGIDLLAHLHGADLGRVGAARAPGDHDRHDQHADLAQHQDADEVDDVLVRAELAEMEEALLRDDAADQEGYKQDDGHGLPAHPVELVHD